MFFELKNYYLKLRGLFFQFCTLYYVFGLIIIHSVYEVLHFPNLNLGMSVLVAIK